MPIGLSLISSQKPLQCPVHPLLSQTKTDDFHFPPFSFLFGIYSFRGRLPPRLSRRFWFFIIFYHSQVCETTLPFVYVPTGKLLSTSTRSHQPIFFLCYKKCETSSSFPPLLRAPPIRHPPIPSTREIPSKLRSSIPRESVNSAPLLGHPVLLPVPKRSFSLDPRLRREGYCRSPPILAKLGTGEHTTSIAIFAGRTRPARPFPAP